MAIIARAWVTGELATSAKLNSISEDITDLDTRLTTLSDVLVDVADLNADLTALSGIVFRGITTLPSNPTLNDYAIYVGNTYRSFSGWGSGLNIPSGESIPRGVARRPGTNTIYLLGYVARRISTWQGNSWSIGTAIPSGETNPTGLSVKSNGDLLVVGITLQKIFTHSGGSWNSGLAIPSAATSPQGLKVRSNGNILLVDDTTNKVYEYNGSSWNAGISTLPETQPRGISEKANGDLVMIGLSDLIRTLRDGNWDAGLKIPSSEGNPSGIEVAANGNFWLAGDSTNKVYTGTYTNPTYPLRKGPCYWNGAQWQLFEKPTVSLTQAEFDAITYKDPGIVYHVF